MDGHKNTDNKLISLELKEAPLGEALKQFSNVSGYKVNFPSEDVGAYRVSVSIHQLAPLAALQKILEGKPFEYEVKQHFITVRKVKPALTTRKVRNIEGRVVDEKGIRCRVRISGESTARLELFPISKEISLVK